MYDFKIVLIKMIEEWFAEEQKKKDFESEMANWCGNNI